MSASPIFEYESYQDFLRDSLEKVKSRNKSFSLRSYAQKLGLTPSYFSEILSEKKNLSVLKAHGVSKALGLSEKESSYFIKLVELGSSKEGVAKDSLAKELRLFLRPIRREEMELAHFKLMSQWYYIPILEMATQQSYATRLSQLSLDLGISPAQVTEALQTLEKLKLIERDGVIYKKTKSHMMISSEIHHKALKEFHSQMLDRAQRALYDQSPQERYTGSETLMVDPSLLSDANAVINECLDRLVQLFSQGLHKTEPYHISVNMFSLKRKAQPKE